MVWLRKKEDVGVVNLHQRADRAERRESQVLEWSRLRHRVQKRVEEQRDMGLRFLPMLHTAVQPLCTVTVKRSPCSLLRRS